MCTLLFSVVKTTVLLAEIKDYPAVNQVYIKCEYTGWIHTNFEFVFRAYFTDSTLGNFIVKDLPSSRLHLRGKGRRFWCMCYEGRGALDVCATMRVGGGGHLTYVLLWGQGSIWHNIMCYFWICYLCVTLWYILNLVEVHCPSPQIPSSCCSDYILLHISWIILLLSNISIVDFTDKYPARAAYQAAALPKVSFTIHVHVAY